MNSFIVNSSEAGMTELDRVDTSFNKSVINFLKSDTKIVSKISL